MEKAVAEDELRVYCDDYWEYCLEHDPAFATYIGDHRYDDRLEDVSEESLAEQASWFRTLLQRVEGIDAGRLTGESRLNRAVLVETLADHLDRYRYRTHYLAVDHLEGPHIDFPQIIEYHPFKTEKDIENYLKRLEAFPVLTGQVIDNLGRGVDFGMTAYERSIRYVLDQVAVFARFSVEEHPLFFPVKNLGEDFPESRKEEIRTSVAEAIRSSITPAYEKMLCFLRDEYVGHCRQEAGIWSLPAGEDMYRFFIRHRTTSGLSPEEINEIGRREVRRISREIGEVLRKAGFTGGVREFAKALRKKRELYPSKGEEILCGFREILSQMDKRLPDFFGRLPRAGYAVKPIEKYREEASPAAYYYPPPGNFSRPGYFYANTYRPWERPKFSMEALAYHEAVPGHHLQMALMQELKDLPDFRRYQGATSFIEGWALYAEKLAKEMGFYQDLYSEYGRLSFELWRAVRLVVDTGLHFYRWGRDESIKYCRENTGMEDHDTEVEVDRYIVMPGQALAYKIGELKMLELRSKARAALGVGFDIREFHDMLLGNGALPLHALESVMHAWMRSKVTKDKHD